MQTTRPPQTTTGTHSTTTGTNSLGQDTGCARTRMQLAVHSAPYAGHVRKHPSTFDVENQTYKQQAATIQKTKKTKKEEITNYKGKHRGHKPNLS